MRSSFVLTVRGMKFLTRVGVLPHEREIAQPLEVDVSVWLRESELGEAAALPALDYRAIHMWAAESVAFEPMDYLEEVVTSVARRALEHADVQRVRVAARKPHVALGGPVDHAEVALELARDG